MAEAGLRNSCMAQVGMYPCDDHALLTHLQPSSQPGGRGITAGLRLCSADAVEMVN